MLLQSQMEPIHSQRFGELLTNLTQSSNIGLIGKSIKILKLVNW